MLLRLILFIHAHHILPLTKKELLRCFRVKYSIFLFFILIDQPVNSLK